jgi:superfamily II DNA or RNA helicase
VSNIAIAEMITRYKSGLSIIISATYQSINRVKHRLSLANIHPTLVFADEAHLISNWITDPKNINNQSKQWLFSLPKIVFLTATPTESQKANPDKWGIHIREVTIAELIQRGVLSEIVSLIPNIRYDNDGKMSKKHLCQVMFKSILTYQRKKSIVFCNTQERCIKLFREFETINKTAPRTITPFIYIGKSLSSSPIESTEANEDDLETETDTVSNDFDNDNVNDNDNDNDSDCESITAFENYNAGPAILFVCRKISMGYDYPPIDFVGFADPKCSKADLSQCIGRGLRVCHGKDKCYIFIPITPDDYEYDTVRKGQYKTIFEYIHYLKTDVGYEIEDTLPRRNPEQQEQVNIDGQILMDAQQQTNHSPQNSVNEDERVEYINPDQLALVLENESVYREGYLGYQTFIKTLKRLNISTPQAYNSYIEGHPLLPWPKTAMDIYHKWSGFCWQLIVDPEHQLYYPTRDICIAQSKSVELAFNEKLRSNPVDTQLKELAKDRKYKKIKFLNQLDPRIPCMPMD